MTGQLPITLEEGCLRQWKMALEYASLLSVGWVAISIYYTNIIKNNSLVWGLESTFRGDNYIIYHSLTMTLAWIRTSSLYIQPSSTTFTMVSFGCLVLTLFTSSCRVLLNFSFGVGLNWVKPYLYRIIFIILRVRSTPSLIF